MTASGPFDPGLQLERTELAWRRTALSIAIGSLLSLRVLPLALPPSAVVWGLAPGFLGLLAACALWIAAHDRQKKLSAFLTGSGEVGATEADSDSAPIRPRATPPGGAMLALVAVLGTVFGGIALLFSLTAALS